MWTFNVFEGSKVSFQKQIVLDCPSLKIFFIYFVPPNPNSFIITKYWIEHDIPSHAFNNAYHTFVVFHKFKKNSEIEKTK